MVDLSANEGQIIAVIVGSVPLVFLLVWFLISTAVARIGGWTSLWRAYNKSHSDEVPKKLGVHSGSVRFSISYTGTLRFGSTDSGLVLSLFWPFSIAHPELLIPWSDISAMASKTIIGQPTVVLSFAKVKGVNLVISQKANSDMQQKVGSQWPTVGNIVSL